MDKSELGNFPSIAVVDDGNGKWVNGPNIAPFAAEFVEDLVPLNQPEE